MRALSALGVRGVGVDVVPSLVEQAQQSGGGDFRVASYEDIAEGSLDLQVDLAVANFYQIGKESVDDLVGSLKRLLIPQAALSSRRFIP